ncbi:hypothetical protein TWF191_005855 [Orbilia oligospora]|uniref:Major facilitator superfamily (MFS) profile domain-containing protein n=1 Tax=Orbilia oligospora TaxID=2813651 RepID=A0A7C8QU08_ORBOL|nr:hypothetical protein TWF191_005855 [Orbilia oligospora]
MSENATTDSSTPAPIASANDDSILSTEPPYSIFDHRQRALIIFIISIAATFSGFASNIYFPALPTIAHDLNVSIELINLTVTSYLIFQGLAPSLWGPISDVKGRRVAYCFTFIVFLGACIGLAESKNYTTLIVLRCLQSTETLRSIVGNGSLTPSSVIARYPLNLYQRTSKTKWKPVISTSPGIDTTRKRVDVIGPFRILISKQAAPIIIFLALYYAVWQMSITAMSSLFEAKYGLSEMEIGLTFIANGVGSMVGTLVTGKILDIDYRRVKTRHESSASMDSEQANNSQESDFPLEKARLRLVPIFSGLQCISILLFGWTIHYPHKVHIAVPIISTFITGWTAISNYSVVVTYLVDIFNDRSAAASASLNLARCLFAAGATFSDT